MVTEYEQLLEQMVKEKKILLEEMKGSKKEKEILKLQNDIHFLESELHRYQQGMALFRSKDVPKVGRWGRPESGESKEEVQ